MSVRSLHLSRPSLSDTLWAPLCEMLSTEFFWPHGRVLDFQHLGDELSFVTVLHLSSESACPFFGSCNKTCVTLFHRHPWSFSVFRHGSVLQNSSPFKKKRKLLPCNASSQKAEFVRNPHTLPLCLGTSVCLFM